MKRIFTALAFTAALAGAVQGADAPAGDAQRTARMHAVIVSGLCRDAAEIQIQENALAGLRAFLSETGGAAAADIAVLDSRESPILAPSQHADAESLAKTVSDLAGRIRDGDTVIFYYRGQANLIGDRLRINLPGPDIDHERLAAILAPLKDRSLVIVLDCPNAGCAVKSLTGPRRIIICGARGDQPYSTHFSAYFVPALSDAENDFDSDGAVSLLEAYRRAVTTIDELYEREGILKTENAVIEDDGDGVPTHRPWEHVEDAYDGAVAARFHFAAREDGGDGDEDRKLQTDEAAGAQERRP